MRINKNTKINGICYNIPTTNIALASSDLNEDLNTYLNKIPKYNLKIKALKIYTEDWTYVSTTSNELYDFELWRCKNGGIILLKNKK